jgi:hypothetical protein
LGDEDHVDLARLRQRQDLFAFGVLLLCPGGDFLPDPDDFVALLLRKWFFFLADRVRGD